MTYKIKDWDDKYENAHSRKVNNAAWLPIPNKHDGKGFRRVAAMKNKVEIFAAWVLILQIASKMPERGVLADEDGDITTEDMAFMTGFPQKIFDEAISALINPKIAWLECDSMTVEQYSTAVERNVAEQNRTEQKGTEDNTVFSFDDFWLLYDKKTGKQDALKKYKRISEEDRTQIKSTLPAYIRATPDSKYRKNPLTYLNGRHWEDEIAVKKSDSPEPVGTMTF